MSEKIVKRQKQGTGEIPLSDDLLQKSPQDKETRREIDRIVSGSGIAIVGIFPNGRISVAPPNGDYEDITEFNPRSTVGVRISSAGIYSDATGKKVRGSYHIHIDSPDSEKLSWNSDALVVNASNVLINRLGFGGTTECDVVFKDYGLSEKYGNRKITLREIAGLNIPLDMK